MKTARALVLDKPKGRMVMGEYPIPSPAPGAILMKMELCGLCGTDVHTWLNESIPLEYPISLGHEMVGKVAALGAGVTADYVGHPLKEGDRITVIPAIHCHRCYFCTIAKTPEKCIHWKTYGTWPRADQEPHFSGGYADYLYIHDPNSVVLKTDAAPERAMFVEPMAIVVHSMLHAKIQPGDTVVVNGAGPIGLLTIALARIGNASRVIAVGVKNRRRLALAKRMGADMTLCHQDIPKQAERKKFVFDHSLNLVGADVVINTAGSPAAFLESIDYVRDSGTLVEVGNFVDNGTVPFNPCTHLLAKGIRMIGSFDNEAEHFVRSLPLVSDERIPITELITHRLPLSAVQKGFEAIHQGRKLAGKEIVKIAIDPTIKERS
jgi:L-iditol 2-dehydrogenase